MGGGVEATFRRRLRELVLAKYGSLDRFYFSQEAISDWIQAFRRSDAPHTSDYPPESYKFKWNQTSVEVEASHASGIFEEFKRHVQEANRHYATALHEARRKQAQREQQLRQERQRAEELRLEVLKNLKP